MNKNTKRSRKKGFCSMKDMETDGNRIVKGVTVDSSWNAKGSHKRTRKSYGSKNNQNY